jgi:hypothetical protein
VLFVPYQYIFFLVPIKMLPSTKDLTGGMGQAAVKPAPESVDTLPNVAALALGSKALRGFRESRERNAGFSFVKDVDGTRTFV